MVGPWSTASPEQVLLELLDFDRRDEGLVLKCCAEVSQWRPLADQAERHGMLGILHGVLVDSSSQLSSDMGTELRRRAALQRLLQTHIYDTLTCVLRAFSDAGIEALTLKGPVLGERLYGHPALRVSTDLDFLIALNRVTDAKVILGGLGYQADTEPIAKERWQHHVTAFASGLPPIELHYRLTSSFAEDFRAEEFLARSRPYRTASGATCRVLSAEDELIFLVLHAVGHLFARLAWLYDIKMFLAKHPDIDWPIVVGRVRSYRVECAFHFATDLIARRMGATLPGVASRPRFYRPRELAARVLLYAAEHSPPGLRAKLFGHLFRAVLFDNPLMGVRNLWSHLRKVSLRS